MKKTLITTAIAIAFFAMGMFSSHAQVVVKIKPKLPKARVVKPTHPGPNFIWRDGHWQWSKKHHTYVWVKGRWMKRKRGYKWVPGHWVKMPDGFKWVPGRWSR